MALRLDRALEEHVDHLGVQVGRDGQSRHVAAVLLHAAGRQELADHPLHLLLVGGLPEDQGELWVLVDPAWKSFGTKILNLFIDYIKILESFVVISRIKRIMRIGL